jgi:hypothetical protein
MVVQSQNLDPTLDILIYASFGTKLIGYDRQWNEIWKWNGTVKDSIDMREKNKNILYKKVKIFVL